MVDDHGHIQGESATRADDAVGGWKGTDCVDIGLPSMLIFLGMSTCISTPNINRSRRPPGP
jgi:hypothetical protein